MGRVVALLVGINAYGDPVRPLTGCVNDVRHLEQYLRTRVGESASIVKLIDDQATRTGIIDAFRDHLAQAGPDDVALFAFAGHGSEEPVPESLAGTESSGKLQNLIVVDAGREVDGERVRPIADKELGLLLAEVGAGGAHVVALMDCCHSGDVTRDLSTATSRGWLPERARAVDAEGNALLEFLRSARADDGFLPGALERAGGEPTLDHVALYACDAAEVANEDAIQGERRGVFSAALLDVLVTAGPTSTYRSLVAAARARVQREFPRQRPSVFPDGASGPADAPFLGGTVSAMPTTFTVTRGKHEWEVDAGEMHGLRSAVGAEAFRLACTGPDGEAAGVVRVVTARAGESTVEPEGWEPQDLAYQATIVTAPRPLASVRFVAGRQEFPGELAAAIRQVLATCSPDGGPSPFVSESVDGATAGSFEFSVAYDPGDGSIGDGSGDENSGPVLTILRADGSPAIRTEPTIPCTDVRSAAASVVDRLEHVAKWEQRRESRPVRPELLDAVRMRLSPRADGEQTVPADAEPIASTGDYVIETDAAGERLLWLEIENTTDDELYFTLLSLTDDLKCSVYLPTGIERLEPGQTRSLKLKLWLSPGIDARPGARSEEWMRLIVSETEFDASDFQLDAISDAADAPVTRGGLEADEPAAAETPVDTGWWSTTVGLVLQVPD